MLFLLCEFFLPCFFFIRLLFFFDYIYNKFFNKVFDILSLVRVAQLKPTLVIRTFIKNDNLILIPYLWSWNLTMFDKVWVVFLSTWLIRSRLTCNIQNLVWNETVRSYDNTEIDISVRCRREKSTREFIYGF